MRYLLLSLFILTAFNFHLNASEVSKKITLTKEVSKFCEKLGEKYKALGWEKFPCEDFEWNHIRDSVKGDPLIWTVFGDASTEDTPKFKENDITIVMCGVHGDEITPMKFCTDLILYMKEIFEDKEKFDSELKNKIVLVAPLVNPDSFFTKKPSRVNAKGVDINRNFPTRDWQRDARNFWIKKYRRDKRRNPGTYAASEPEVIFQMNLIKRYGPDKIISVHAPLTLLDYDGPNTIVTSENGNKVDGAKAEELLIQISKDASDYKIQNYPFFPGSLGNWAGKERDIPTYTLELPSSDPSKSKDYWSLFKSSMYKAVINNVKNLETTTVKVESSTQTTPEQNAQQVQ